MYMTINCLMENCIYFLGEALNGELYLVLREKPLMGNCTLFQGKSP